MFWLGVLAGVVGTAIIVAVGGTVLAFKVFSDS